MQGFIEISEIRKKQNDFKSVHFECWMVLFYTILEKVAFHWLFIHECRKNGVIVQWKGIFNLINILVKSDGNAIADLQHNFRITLDSFGHKWKPIAHDQTSKKGLRQVCICPRWDQCDQIFPNIWIDIK